MPERWDFLASGRLGLGVLRAGLPWHIQHQLPEDVRLRDLRLKTAIGLWA